MGAYYFSDMRSFFLFLCCGIALPGAAQTAVSPASAPPAAPSELSLDQAIALAKSTQGAYRNLVLDEQIAGQSTRATRGLYTPHLGAAADLRYNAILPTSVVPNFANLSSGERLALRFGTRYQASAGLTATQRLYDANALAQRRVDAVNEQLAANITLRGRVLLVQNVSTAYYEALLRETQLAFAQADQASSQATYQDALARQRAGRALAIDVSAALINRRSAELAFDLARQNIILSKHNLLAILGQPADQAATLRLTDPLASLLRVGADTTAWTGDGATAVGRRPEFRQEQLSGELAAATLGAERSGYAPTVGLVGYLGANGFDDGLINALDPVHHWFGNSYLALQASLPLLDGAARASRIETQRLRQQQARNRQSDLQQSIRYEVANARTLLQNAYQTLRVRQQNVAVATQSAQLVRWRQEAGRALPREILDAELTRQQAQRDYLQAVYDFLAARLEYARTTGALAD